MFMVVHLPKDKVNLICEYAVHVITDKSQRMGDLIVDQNIHGSDLTYFAVRIKRIVFLISLIIIAYPVTRSLKRAGFLWDSQKCRRRFIYSGIIFLFLSLFELPINLRSAGAHYASMSLSPFEATTGWYYRRLLAPAIAHFLGFQGHFLFYLFSLALNFVLIFFVIAYIESEAVPLNIVHLLSITTSSFVILNFHIQGFSDPLMFILFLISVTAVHDYESRLALIALALVTHEASAFVLLPLILFFFPRRKLYSYLIVLALYFALLLLSFKLNVKELISLQIVLDNKIGVGWLLEYPIRALGGWFVAYKLLWCIVIFALWKMVKAFDLTRVLLISCLVLVSPLALIFLCVDVSRFVGFGFLGLLMSYTFLLRSGYGNNKFIRYIMLANIIVPSLYVGSNNGFRTVPGLYEWLYELYGLRGLLADF